MKMELLLKACEGRSMIRLFAYESDEVNLLRLVCLELAYGRIAELALHEQPWCKPVGGCQLILRTSQTDDGIEVPAPGEPFVLRYSKDAWLEVEGKLWPFAERSGGYNWLTMEGDVDPLISWDGGW